MGGLPPFVQKSGIFSTLLSEAVQSKKNHQNFRKMANIAKTQKMLKSAKKLA
jgi:hypothetical protein